MTGKIIEGEKRTCDGKWIWIHAVLRTTWVYCICTNRCEGEEKCLLISLRLLPAQVLGLQLYQQVSSTACHLLWPLQSFISSSCSEGFKEDRAWKQGQVTKWKQTHTSLQTEHKCNAYYSLGSSFTRKEAKSANHITQIALICVRVYAVHAISFLPASLRQSTVSPCCLSNFSTYSTQHVDICIHRSLLPWLK